MVTAMAFLLQPVSAQPFDQVTLRLAWIAGFGGDQVPFFLGNAKGFYKEQGIDLKIVDGRGAASNATLLAQKSEQFAVIDANVLALSVGNGLPIRSIGTFVQQAPFDLIYGTKSGINSFADLKGRTVGLQPGEAMTALFSALLTANNVDPSTVRIVSVTAPISRRSSIRDKLTSSVAMSPASSFVSSLARPTVSKFSSCSTRMAALPRSMLPLPPMPI